MGYAHGHQHPPKIKQITPPSKISIRFQEGVWRPKTLRILLILEGSVKYQELKVPQAKKREISWIVVMIL